MKNLNFQLFLLTLLPLGTLSAATVTFDSLSFETPLSTIPGFTISEPNSAATLIAWAEPVGPTMNMAGALGGAYAEAFNPSVWLTMASSLYSSTSGVSMDIFLKEGTLDRDTFGIALRNGSGAPLMTIVLAPTATSGGIAKWEIGYALANGPVTYTGIALNEDSWYGVSVNFTGSNFNMAFANTLSTIPFSGTIAGYDGATAGLGNVSLTWTKAAATPFGDNYMIFDNIAVVPEPSAALLSGLASLLLLRRRR